MNTEYMREFEARLSAMERQRDALALHVANLYELLRKAGITVPGESFAVPQTQRTRDQLLELNRRVS